MKRAFTLIELLVVIAIIAILAAILFPVFAQAKIAAKKTVSISNQKQLGIAVILYANDADDHYPRNDDCILNSSLDPKWNNKPAGTNPAPWCNSPNTPGGYAFRFNHYAWQKWVLPYTKSVGVYKHPGMAVIPGSNVDPNGAPTLFDQGEIYNGYALNIAITGAQNTWGYREPYTNVAAIRESFVGGTQTGIASPAEAMIMTEQWFCPVTGGYEIPGSTAMTTNYPMAIREHWESVFLKNGGSGYCGNVPGQVDPTKVPFGTVPVSYADGHTKGMAVGDFLAKTPTMAQYGVPPSTAYCKLTAAYYSGLNTAPAYQGSWPFWGLQ